MPESPRNSILEKLTASTRPELPVIAIVGRPNVGKSSFFNAVIGRRMSIVHEMSGVTRDRLSSPATHRLGNFLLMDTGGLGMLNGEKHASDFFDKSIAEQVEVAIEGADALIFVTNVQDGVVTLDEEVASRLRVCGKPVVLAVNKCDNPELELESHEFCSLGFDTVVPVSCLHRRGIDAAVGEALKTIPAEKRPAATDEKIVSPLRIAVVGRPNVGKSSLVNALLGEERVIVSDVAGTTRDAIDIDFTVRYRDGEIGAVLVDTAGLRKRGKVDTVVEYFSTMRSESAIEHADLVLFVVEASPDGATAQDRKIASKIETAGKACIIVANKYDVVRDQCKAKLIETELRRTLYGMSYAPLVLVSAAKRFHLDELLDALSEVIGNLEQKLPTSLVNKFFREAFDHTTPPVVGVAPLKLYYASMIGTLPPRFLLFVNEPAYCAENYLAYLKKSLRNAFDFTGLPVVIELRARPKKVTSFHTVREKPMTMRGKKLKK